MEMGKEGDGERDRYLWEGDGGEGDGDGRLIEWRRRWRYGRKRIGI